MFITCMAGGLVLSLINPKELIPQTSAESFYELSQPEFAPQPKPKVSSAVEYLLSHYKPDVGLITRGMIPEDWNIYWLPEDTNVYWLYPDNFIAEKALRPHYPLLADKIKKWMETYTFQTSIGGSDLYEVLFGETIPEPIHSPVDFWLKTFKKSKGLEYWMEDDILHIKPVEYGANAVILSRKYCGDETEDLYFYKVLNKLWRPLPHVNSDLLIDYECGKMRMNESDNFELALYIYTGRLLGQDSDDLAKKLWAQQHSSGGIPANSESNEPDISTTALTLISDDAELIKELIERQKRNWRVVI